MGSSESTPSRPSDGRIPLFVAIVGDDHPKACTGRRLLRRGLAQPIAAHGSLRAPPVVLDPFAKRPLSAGDRAGVVAGGILAVDCSWNRISEVGRLPPVFGARHRWGRRLPLLIAGNPQHYGKIGELNTAEALGAALCVVGRREEAAALLEGFHGGPAFLELNEGRFARYRVAEGTQQVVAAEQELFGGSTA